MSSNFITGLDIGTSNVKVAVAENKNGRPILRSVFKRPSSGLRKGAIVDISETAAVVRGALDEVRKISKQAVKNIYVNVGTTHVKVHNSKGIVAVSRADNEIYQDDIDRVIKASQAVNNSQNRIIVHTITKEFIIDGASDIMDPMGLTGSRLEVQSIVIDAFSQHIKNIMRCVELGNGQIGGLVFNPLAASRSALSKKQKELGTILVDIGFGTTSVAVFEESKLLTVKIFPVGAGNITNDIAVGLKIPVGVAESLKLHYGYAVAREVGTKDAIDLKKFSEDARGMITRRFLAEIIEARLAEILEFVNNELKLVGRAGQLAGGIVFVGGGSKTPGLTELAKQELKLSSQIGMPVSEDWIGSKEAKTEDTFKGVLKIRSEHGKETEDFSEFLDDPEFINVLGLVLWGTTQDKWAPQENILGFSGAKNIFRYFVP